MLAQIEHHFQKRESFAFDVIARRFEAGFRNFENLYKAQADAWALYDNSGIEPVLLNWGEK